jgi:hypothetical protein
MSFEQSKFGDGSNAGSGNVVSTVHNFFGPRPGKGEGLVGVYETDGMGHELAININGDMVSAAAFQLLAPKLPKGAKIQDVLLQVFEAFVLGGTTPAIKVGTSGSEATNGVGITQAQAQAIGTYNLTSALAGTWATALTAGVTVGVAMSGTTPTSTSAGKARLVIRYDNISSK